MKKASLILCVMLCLTSCAQPSAPEISSLPSSVIPVSSSEESSSPIQVVDPQIQKIADDLRDPTYKAQVDFAQGLDTGEYGEAKTDAFSEGLADLLLTSPHESTTQLEHGTLEAETDPDCIGIEVIGKEQWTEIDYYLLTDSYGELAGKLYIEVTTSTEILHGLYYYDLANASCYLYDGDVFQKTIDLIKLHNTNL